MAAPAFVAASTAISAALTPFSVSPAFPTGTTTGDIVFALCCAVQSTNATFTAPGSFVSMGKVTGTSYNTSEWFWDRVEAGDDTAPTFSASGTLNSIHVALITYRNCLATGTPFEDATTAGETTSATPTSAVVTPTVAESTTVCFSNVPDNPAWTTGPPPANWTTRMDLTNSTGLDSRLSVIELTSSAAKDSNVSAVSLGTLASSELWATLTCVIKPTATAEALGPIIIGTDKIGLRYTLA